MSVKIAHAVRSETGGHEGAAGNQTGKELEIRGWYPRSDGWTGVLRYPGLDVAEEIAKAAEDFVANKNIGYGQSNRNTSHVRLVKAGYDVKKIKSSCNTDCSLMAILCAMVAQHKVLGYSELDYPNNENGPYTGNMQAKLEAAGFEFLSGDEYCDTDRNLRRGDIVYKKGVHAIVVLEDGAPAAFKNLKVGSSGDAVKVWQSIIGVTVDGMFGGKTKDATIELQKRLFPSAPAEWDGVVGKKTLNKAIESIFGVQ